MGHPGLRRITRRGLVPGIRASATGTLHALASRDLDMARSWAAEFDVPRAYGSYQEVLDDPEVDAIYIPLPNELHQSWVLAAADAGKHDPLREAAGPRRTPGRGDGRVLPQARRAADGGVHVASSAAVAGAPQARPRGERSASSG